MGRVSWCVPLLLSACGPAQPAAPAAAEAEAAVLLGGTDGDVWAWQLRVRGTADPERCARISVESPRAVVPAALNGGRFATAVPLDEGRNRVVARCHLRGGGVIRSPARDWHVRLEDRPRAWIRVVVLDEGVALDGGATERSPVHEAPIVRWEWSAAGDNPAPLPLGDGRRIVVPPPAVDGEYYVTLRVTDVAGRTDESSAYFVVEHGEPRVVDAEHEHAAWVDEAIVYGVVPFLFGEHPLVDVRRRLDSLSRLGIDTLWLSPVFEAPDGDFGYAVVDYFGVRAAYGTAEDLRALVEAAHARGMRVLLDLVPNHTSDRHPYFLQARREGPGSRYWGFYEHGPDGEPLHYFDWENLPNLDFDDPEVRRWMLEIGTYWVRELDVDGYRVDVAWGVRRRAPELWPTFRAEVKRVKPNVLLLAEATARDPYWFDDGFDAAYDWTWELGEWAWAEAFEGGTVDVERLNAALTNGDEGFPEDALVFRFLDNNDTGLRFRTRFDAALERPASLLLFTVPGLPSLYTGAEVGMEYEPYRRETPLDWAAARPVPYHARHIALRRAHAALRSGLFEPVPAVAEEPVYAFLRTDPDTGERILVAINFGEAETRARLAVDEDAVPEGARAFWDVLHGERVFLTGEPRSLRIPARTGRVLRLAAGTDAPEGMASRGPRTARPTPGRSELSTLAGRAVRRALWSQ